MLKAPEEDNQSDCRPCSPRKDFQPRQEVAERFDGIVDFAGVRDFIDMPLRTYSSGMAARLHFAVASSIRPEVLLIDEALAVGDHDFKEKSSKRIEQLRAEAGTVFIVSHSLGTIIETCSRAVWMERGRVMQDGKPEAVVDAYVNSIKR